MVKVDLSKTFIDIDKSVYGSKQTFLLGTQTDGKVDFLLTANGDYQFATIPKEPLTLKKVIEEVLLVDGKDERLSEEEKNKRSKLGLKILMSESSEFEFESEEIVFMKKIIYAKRPTLIAGQADNHLENK